MPKYIVEVAQPKCRVIEVEAESKYEAVAAAEAEAGNTYSGFWDATAIHIKRKGGQYEYIASIETNWSQGF